MGISYDSGTETITVAGGSWLEPYTMAILNDDATVGGLITAGGYGNREYTVSKNLIIGSDDGNTFFDLSGSVIIAADGYTITCYSHAIRGGRCCTTWAASAFGAEVPVMGDDAKQRVQNVVRLFLRKRMVMDDSTGDWVDERKQAERLTPEIVRRSMFESLRPTAQRGIPAVGMKSWLRSRSVSLPQPHIVDYISDLVDLDHVEGAAWDRPNVIHRTGRAAMEVVAVFTDSETVR